MKKPISIVLFLLGTIVATVAAGPAAGPPTVTFPYSGQITCADYRSGTQVAVVLTGNAILSVDIDPVPKAVHPGEAFLLTVKARLQSMKIDPPGLVQNPVSGAFFMVAPPLVLAKQKEVEDSLSKLPFVFRLHLAGATIHPTGDAKPKNGVVTWSITPTGSTRTQLAGTITVEVSPQPAGDDEFDKPASGVPVTIPLAVQK